jgi:ATP-binding cassette, subfamily C (CFTR/MRP), member 1
VGLARAVYSRADIILLDDVLAALDSHVARHVMDQVIGHQGLLATKARIVVTHGIAHINKFDTVLYLRRGIVMDQGPAEEVLRRDESELSKLVRGHSADLSRSGRSTPRSREEPRSDDDATTVVESSREESQWEPARSPNSGPLSNRRRESFGKAKLLGALPVQQPAEATKEHREKGLHPLLYASSSVERRDAQAVLNGMYT